MISRFYRLYGPLALVSVLLAGNASMAAPVSRLETILAAGVMRVCICPEQYAVARYDPVTGTLRGVDVDLSRALAADLGVSTRYVNSSSGRLAQDIRNGRCDIGMHATDVDGVDTLVVDSSEPYMVSGIHVVTRRHDPAILDWPDLDRQGRVVVVQKGSNLVPLTRAALRWATVLEVDGAFAREQEVRAGRADAFIANSFYGNEVVAMSGWARALELPVTFVSISYVSIVPVGDPAWLARVNSFVQAARTDGRLEAAGQGGGL